MTTTDDGSARLADLLSQAMRDAKELSPEQIKGVAWQRATTFWANESWRLRRTLEGDMVTWAQATKSSRQGDDRMAVLAFCDELQAKRKRAASAAYTKDDLARKAADHFAKGGSVSIDGQDVKPSKAPAQATIRRWLRGEKATK
jgi:hypothetical protein